MLDKPHMNIRLRGLEECDDVIFAGFSDSCNLPSKSQMGNGPYWQIIYEMGQYVDGGQILILVYMDKSVSHTYGK